MKAKVNSHPTLLGQWCSLFITMFVITVMIPAFVFSQPYSNPSAVPLLTAGTYGALAFSGISGSASVTGDIGTTSSTISVSITPSGTNWGVGGQHNADAQTDLTAALTNANGRTNDEVLAADALGGRTLGCGVYGGTALDLASNTTLTLNGTDTDVFIFKAGSTLTINTNSTIALTGGAVWSNVFWYVGSSATVFSGTTFSGIILANVSITVNAGASLVTAKLLASTGAVTINSDVLPVELVSFTATANRSSAHLHWNTATELNNYGFEVQKKAVSGQISDNHWTTSGFVEGNGTTNAPKEYSYTESNLVPGTYSYRLKQIDRDGRFEYSQSVEMEILPAPQKNALLNNYPNPFNPSTVIHYSLAAGGEVSLKVYNAIGEEVADLVHSRQEAGEYSVPFTALSGAHVLSSGVYFYRLQSGVFAETKKMLLMQ